MFVNGNATSAVIGDRNFWPNAQIGLGQGYKLDFLAPRWHAERLADHHWGLNGSRWL